MPQSWKQAPLQRVYERRTLQGYGIFPLPLTVTMYPDSATITIDIQASGTDEYAEGVAGSHLGAPKVITVQSRMAALRGRRY